VPANLDLFPQDSPKASLTSAVKAVEKERTDYLAAHLIDPAFIDRKVEERAGLMQKEVAADFQARREAQARNPVPGEDRIPADPKGFDEAVRREAARRAFRLVARDIRGTLDENPDHLNDLRRFLREGQFTDAGDTASAALRGGQGGRSVHFRKTDGRWYVQDRMRPEPEPKK
jgi:hypothetical protein